MANSKRVTINPTVEVHHVLSIHDYTASEISAAWYNEHEMDKIAQRCFKILSKVQSVKSNSGQKYNIRGLESHTTLGSISKQNNRSAAYEVVFDEQQRQYENEESDVQAISDAYQRTTSSSQIWAQVVGRRDEKAVEAYLYEEEEEETTVFLATPAELKVTDSKILSPVRIRRRLSGNTDALSPMPRAA
ncbi:unnamed protein product [Cylindrotheca closterium]|uniref:Uncharacterized protein n=1 Tax=Cylindrotheca closterium TaxID=2856 RepID=A0AAD2JID8_9STRA|nr:unnamed protein product [Cylindrotheca closterium]